jgi:hypothetical protein
MNDHNWRNLIASGIAVAAATLLIGEGSQWLATLIVIWRGP